MQHNTGIKQDEKINRANVVRTRIPNRCNIPGGVDFSKTTRTGFECNFSSSCKGLATEFAIMNDTRVRRIQSSVL